MRRSVLVAGLVLLLLAIPLAAAAASRPQRPGTDSVLSGNRFAVDPEDLDAGLPEGITIDLLASVVLAGDDPSVDPAQAPFPNSYPTLALERLPLAAEDEIEGAELPLQDRVEYLPQLLYVEEGDVVLSSDAGERDLAQGDEAYVPRGEKFRIYNSTDDCAYLLRLTYQFGGGFAGPGPDSAGPERADAACDGERAVLLQVNRETAPTDWPSESSVLLFVARMKWDADYVYAPGDPASVHTHAGSMGLRVESGSLEVGIQAGENRAVAVLSAGSQIELPADLPHREFPRSRGESTAVLAIGWIAADDPLLVEYDAAAVPDPTVVETEETNDGGGGSDAFGGLDGNAYTSPTYGYTLEWDPNEWRTIAGGEVIADGEARYDQFGLENGVSSIWIWGQTTYAGDAGVCLEDQVDRLRTDDRVDDVEMATDAEDEPIVGESEDHAFAVHHYTLTDQNGTSDLTAFMECRTLVPGTSVLGVSQYVAAADYNDQIAARASLLDGLRLPGDGYVVFSKAW